MYCVRFGPRARLLFRLPSSRVFQSFVESERFVASNPFCLVALAAGPL